MMNSISDNAHPLSEHVEESHLGSGGSSRSIDERTPSPSADEGGLASSAEVEDLVMNSSSDNAHPLSERIEEAVEVLLVVGLSTKEHRCKMC